MKNWELSNNNWLQGGATKRQLGWFTTMAYQGQLSYRRVVVVWIKNVKKCEKNVFQKCNLKKCEKMHFKNVKKMYFFKQFWGFVLLCFAPGSHCFAIAKFNRSAICTVHFRSVWTAPLRFSTCRSWAGSKVTAAKLEPKKNQTWRRRNQSSTFPTGFSNVFHIFPHFFHIFSHFFAFFTCFFAFFSHFFFAFFFQVHFQNAFCLHFFYIFSHFWNAFLSHFLKLHFWNTVFSHFSHF